MEKSDHITLNLPTSIGTSNGGSDEFLETSGSSFLPRRSLRRSWNQLSRCQRNLICLGTFIIIFTSLLIFQDVDSPTSLMKSYSNDNHEIRKEDLQSPAAKLESDRVLQSAETMQGSHETFTFTSTKDSGLARDSKANNPKTIRLRLAPIVPKEDQSIDDTKYQPKESEDENPKEFKDSINVNPFVNIQQLDLNANHVETHNQQDLIDLYHAKIKEIIQDPQKMPSLYGNGATIDEFLQNLGSPKDAQKQHFHGANNERQAAVVEAFRHSWNGYKKYAWGHDHLKPISQIGQDWFGLGLTIVDALDTIYIMGLEDEFAEARDWVRDHLSFDINRDVNLFEVTIRVLGGLLSAYHLSGDQIFLKRSIELGNRLLPCFLTPSGIPYSDVNLSDRSAHAPKWSPDSSTSEVTTIQLEFRDLSRSTNTVLYERVAHNVNEKVHALDKNKGLVPIFINANTGTFRNFATISLGARGDSYYEYLLKQWIQTGRKDDDFLILDYMRAVDGILTELMRRTPKEQYVYVGELINGKDFKPKMDHLTCYLPGTLLLGHHFGMPDAHLLLAKDLLETCYQTYIKQPTNLAPEISYFAVNEGDEQDIYVKPNDAHNLLRPEFIESLYYFYALTGNRTYQDMGWKIFQAFETHTKVASGYTSIGNVKNTMNTRLRDMMESFWLGETLKYFYLLFSDNRKEIDLEKWIFNTEAHLVPVRNN